MESHFLHWAHIHSHKFQFSSLSPKFSLSSAFHPLQKSSNASSPSLSLMTSTEWSADWYLKVWSIYVMPALIVLGVLNNVLILAIMPLSAVAVPLRVKRFYIMVALGDLLVVSSDFFQE